MHERFQHEPPAAESRVRHHEARLVEDLIPKQHEIEIERARGARSRPLASALLLDREQRLEQITRAERRLADGNGIQEPRLLTRDIDRIGLDVAGDPDVAENRSEAGRGIVEMRAAVPKIAAERDGDCRGYSIHRLESTSP